jgi:hypothetical protein
MAIADRGGKDEDTVVHSQLNRQGVFLRIVPQSNGIFAHQKDLGNFHAPYEYKC